MRGLGGSGLELAMWGLIRHLETDLIESWCGVSHKTASALELHWVVETCKGSCYPLKGYGGKVPFKLLSKVRRKVRKKGVRFLDKPNDWCP